MRVCPSCQSRYPTDDPFCSKDGNATIEADPNIRFDPLIGSNVGNYKITSLLGEGGMGSVYRAEHPSIGRVVAIKVLRGEYAYRQDTIERFFNEAKAVNQIRHENIVDIIDFGLLNDQRPYFIMEYLEGSDLDGYLRKKRALSVTEALDIMMPVLSALQAAHDEGIIHRDLKPENIFLFERKHGGRVVKLLDFGIAKLLDAKEQFHKTNTGSIIGTPAYMSPEQAAGRKDIDHRADIYAAGIILYELLVGEPPFDGDTALEIVHKQWKEKPPSPRKKRPDLPEEFEQIIFAALEKDRDARIQTASQFAQQLKTSIAKVSASLAKHSIKQPAANPGPRLSSNPGLASLPKPVAKKEPTPQPLTAKKEPTPQPPKGRILSSGYPILKPPTNPGSASPKLPAKSGGWSVIKPAKLPESGLPSIQKSGSPFKKTPAPNFKEEQSTEAGSLSPNLFRATNRSEETRMVSEITGGYIDDLRRPIPSKDQNTSDASTDAIDLESTHMGSVITGGSVEALRSEETRMVSDLVGGSLDDLRKPSKDKDQNTDAGNDPIDLAAIESTHMGSVITGGSVEALRGEETRMVSDITGGSVEALRGEETRMVSDITGGSLDELRNEATRMADLSGGVPMPSVTAKPTSKNLPSLSAKTPAKLAESVLRSEETRMVSDITGGSLDELRSEATRMADLSSSPLRVNTPTASVQISEHLDEDVDASTVAGQTEMTEELAAALRGAESDSFFSNIEAPELLGDESTNSEAKAYRDLEDDVPALSPYEEPSIMKELPSKKEDITSAHTSILQDYHQMIPPDPDGSGLNQVTSPEMPVFSVASPAERAPRRETPPISGEIKQPAKPSSQPSKTSRVLLLFVVLAVVSGGVAVLARQLGLFSSVPQSAVKAVEQNAPKKVEVAPPASTPNPTTAAVAASAPTAPTPTNTTPQDPKPEEPKNKDPKPKPKPKDPKETKTEPTPGEPEPGLVDPFGRKIKK